MILFFHIPADPVSRLARSQSGGFTRRPFGGHVRCSSGGFTRCSSGGLADLSAVSLAERLTDTIISFMV